MSTNQITDTPTASAASPILEALQHFEAELWDVQHNANFHGFVRLYAVNNRVMELAASLLSHADPDSWEVLCLEEAKDEAIRMLSLAQSSELFGFNLAAPLVEGQFYREVSDAVGKFSRVAVVLAYSLLASGV